MVGPLVRPLVGWLVGSFVRPSVRPHITSKTDYVAIPSSLGIRWSPCFVFFLHYPFRLTSCWFPAVTWCLLPEFPPSTWCRDFFFDPPPCVPLFRGWEFAATSSSLDSFWIGLISIRLINLIWIDLNWFALIWIDLNWFELIWIDLNWFDLNWFELIWTDLNWFE
jgi:hypothetical protein